MNIAIVYILPVVNPKLYCKMARRFRDTYMEFPPGESDHTLHVIVNGGSPQPQHDELFQPLACEFGSHTNHGKDIGAFQQAAARLPCDLLVCFGSHIHFTRAGWLDRMAQVFRDQGPALYGAWGFNRPSPNLRTTGFWLPPDLLRAYPWTVGNSGRYEFERGSERGLASWANREGFGCYMVTWNSVYPMSEWGKCGYEDCLIMDQHSEVKP